MQFQEPLLQLANLPDNNIEPGQVLKMFGTLPQIIPLNVELLSQVEARMIHWDESSTIGDIFIKMVLLSRSSFESVSHAAASSGALFKDVQRL